VQKHRACQKEQARKDSDQSLVRQKDASDNLAQKSHLADSCASNEYIQTGDASKETAPAPDTGKHALLSLLCSIHANNSLFVSQKRETFSL
jgi:hypothetical protein